MTPEQVREGVARERVAGRLQRLVDGWEALGYLYAGTPAARAYRGCAEAARLLRRELLEGEV